MDEIKEDGMKSIIALIKENDANWKIGLSGGNVDSGIENSLYDYSTILGYERQSDNAVSGDFNMIYRSENTAAAVPISSIRLELLREGIQDFEKARILNNGQLDAAIRNFTSASGREAAKWVGIAEGTLKELSAND